MFHNQISSMTPLNVGNIVTAALRIYRDYYKSYLTVAIPATLWFLLPFLVLTFIRLVWSYFQASISSSSFLFLIPFWLLLFFYCAAKSIVNTAIIGRLVFGVLTNQPETVSEARQTLSPKIWAFLALFLIGVTVTFVVAFLLLIVLNTIDSITRYSVNQNIIDVAFLAISLILFMTLLNRFVIFQMPLTLEENMTATQTLRRSLELTKGYVSRNFVIVLVAILVALPVGVTWFIIGKISEIVFKILYLILRLEVPISTSSQTYSSLETLFYTLLIVIISVLPFGMNFLLTLVTLIIIIVNIKLNYLNFLLIPLLFFYATYSLTNIVLLPFWQAIKAVIYYDLRSRQEGIDLQLRKRRI